MSKSKRISLLLFLILLVAACKGLDQKTPAVDPVNELAGQEWVTDYLSAKIAITGFGGKTFCAYQLLNAVQEKDGNIYLWALCQEYYLDQGDLTAGSGISLPVALQIQVKNDQIDIIGHRIPRDGSYFGPDVRDIFPQSTWAEIMPEDIDQINQYNDRANALGELNRTKAGEFYETSIP